MTSVVKVFVVTSSLLRGGRVGDCNNIQINHPPPKKEKIPSLFLLKIMLKKHKSCVINTILLKNKKNNTKTKN